MANQGIFYRELFRNNNFICTLTSNLRIITCLQSIKMSKKQSVKVRTIDVAEMINIKTRLPNTAHQTISVEPQYKTSIKHKTENSAKFSNMLKLAKKQQIIRLKIDQLIREAESSPIKINDQKLSLKQFPKRQKSIKNSNPYRYFLSSKSERLPTQDKVFTEPVLHFNLTKILKEKFSIRIKCNSLGNRAATQTDVPSQNRKTFSRKHFTSQKKLNQSFSSELQPWLMTETEEAISHPIPYSK